MLMFMSRLAPPPPRSLTPRPMRNQHMQIVEGPFRLPLLRGEQSPLTMLFRR